MTLLINNRTLITILSFTLTFSSFLSAKPMPEFGSSVEFDKAETTLTMAGLKDKAIIIVFFQSWCGKCNVWAPNLIKQLEKTHGNNCGVVMIALKTDGGGLSGAKGYMKAKGADPSLWTIGSDKNAAYYKQVTGSDALWGYALVDTEGNIVKNGKAGSYSRGSNPKSYILAQKSLLSECGELSSRLPADKTYPPELAQVVKLTEIGCYGSALALCSSPKLKSKFRQPVADMNKEIMIIVDKQIADRTTILQDKEQDGPARYDAYKELQEIVKPLRYAASARKASSLISKSKMDPVIQKEIRAETAYTKLMKRKQKSSKQGIPRINGEFKKLSKLYPNTKYGTLAAAESEL